MNKSELLSLYDAQLRINLRLPDSIFENTGRIVRDRDLVEHAGFIDYASPMSEPVLAKHGFQSLGQTTYCRWSPK